MTSKRGTVEQPLLPIIGEQISAVVFVQDYLQFQFDGPVLTAITDPTVTVNGVGYVRAHRDFCNMLVSCIAHIVADATVTEGDEIRITFDNGSSIAISLKPEDYRTAEGAWFNNGPEDWWVW